MILPLARLEDEVIFFGLLGITISLWPFQLLRNRTLGIQSGCS